MTPHSPKPTYQKIEQDPVFPVSCIYMESQPSVDLFYCHWHPNIEIIYITEGAVDMRIDSKDFYLEQGDICIVNPNEVHFGTEHNGRYTYVDLMVLSYDILNQNLDDPIFQQLIQPLVQGHSKLPTVIKYFHKSNEQSTAYKACLEIVLKLIKVGQNPHVGYELSIQGLFLQLLATFHQYQLLIPTDTVIHQGVGSREMAILRYMDQHFTKTLSISDMAKDFDISEDYFYKVFKKATGQTPINYILQLRVQYAKQLLKTTDMSISDIGYEVGFDSSSYFSKTFKKLTGLTPRKYRNNY